MDLVYNLSEEFLNKFKAYMTEPIIETRSQHNIDYREKREAIRDINSYLIGMHSSDFDYIGEFCQKNIPPFYMQKILKLIEEV